MSELDTSDRLWRQNESGITYRESNPSRASEMSCNLDATDPDPANCRRPERTDTTKTRNNHRSIKLSSLLLSACFCYFICYLQSAETRAECLKLQEFLPQTIGSPRATGQLARLTKRSSSSVDFGTDAAPPSDARELDDEEPPDAETHASAANGLLAPIGIGAQSESDSERRRAQSASSSKLRIVRLFAPEAVQNATQNVTIDCMFRFDGRLDSRLTLKWFFNDELEPIYQWIPELNKRVYSDRYEKFLDKSYQVNEDVEFMLQAYKWLHSSGAEPESPATRQTLAAKLTRLAGLGGGHSRQLVESLRSALAMDAPEFSRFRALRLVAPTSELSGRFTCSLSSLDGDDLRSASLLVFEPAKSFNFNVTRIAASPNQYRLSCRAQDAFPRPTLALYRYRAGPASPELGSRAASPARPRLAATQLRPELLPGTQTQLIVRSPSAAANEEPAAISTPEPNDIANAIDSAAQQVAGPVAYEISASAVVDEASLSSNVVTQFECHLSIEGTKYEQRQSLSLQRAPAATRFGALIAAPQRESYRCAAPIAG